MGTIFLIYTQNSFSILDPVPVTLICIVIFGLGFWLGNLKSRKLIRKMNKMEKKIMDLNTELLYGSSAKQKKAPGTTRGPLS